MPDLVSRPHRAPGRQVLRRHPGRRLARHGDARARDHRAGDARDDDPAGPRGDARLRAGAGGGRYAVRLLRGVEGAGLHERRAGDEGNRLRRDQGRGRPAAGRDDCLSRRARRAGDGACRPHAAGDQHHRLVPRPGPRGEGLGPIEDDAKSVADAGAFSLVIEAVAEPLGRRITGQVAIPTIGIGASAACDGQILVLEDMLGLSPRVPKFVKRYGDIGPGIEAAVAGYAKDVRSRAFPGPDQVYGMKKK